MLYEIDIFSIFLKNFGHIPSRVADNICKAEYTNYARHEMRNVSIDAAPDIPDPHEHAELEEIADDAFDNTENVTFICVHQSAAFKFASRKGILAIAYTRIPDQNFSGAFTVTVGNAKTTSKTVKGKAGKKYFVRIRTYKTVGGKKYYSAWSKAKTVTVKR